MNTNTIVVISFIVIASFIVYFLLRNKNHKTYTLAPSIPEESLTPTIDHTDNGFEFSIIDENGSKIIETKEIETFPLKAYRIDSSDSAINRVRHMTSDLFKGSVSIQNKTIEIVFKEDIQKGLADGTYTLMQTNSGEVLADAVDSSGKIVGKGRLIQGGKARQLASGAFQLVSIAVAQSHLADIEQSLCNIKDLISEVIERQENEDKAKISGAFDYLHEIAEYMKDLKCPEELSQQKRNAIENIIKDAYSWRNKLDEDLSSLINQISNLSDLDTFGTGSTYERLKKLTGDLDILLNRRRLFLNLVSATNFVTTYLDPSHRDFSKVIPENEQWESKVDKYKDSVLNKIKDLMSESFWNSSETLELRKKDIKSLADNFRRDSMEQESKYISLQKSLEKSVNSFIDSKGDVHVAIAFDNLGEVNCAAIM